FTDPARPDERQLLQLLEFCVDLTDRRAPVEEPDAPVGPLLQVVPCELLAEREHPEDRPTGRRQVGVAINGGHGRQCYSRSAPARVSAAYPSAQRDRAGRAGFTGRIVLESVRYDVGHSWWRPAAADGPLSRTDARAAWPGPRLGEERR